MIRKTRKFRPVVGDATLEHRVVLSAPGTLHIAAVKNVTYKAVGRLTSASFDWDTGAKTVTFSSKSPATIKGLGTFNITGQFTNVAYMKSGQIRGSITMTLTSTTDPASTLVFSVRGPNPGVSPKIPVPTVENLTLTSATGTFSKLSNRPGSIGTIVMPALNLPKKAPPHVTGTAILRDVTLNFQKRS
jgi:hypothetical protein